MAGTVETDLHKQQKFLRTILIIGIVVTAVSVILSYRFKQDKNPMPKTDIVNLYTTTKPCGMHVHVDCDEQPEELVIISPDGTEISEFLWENNNAANILIESAMNGQWQLRYTAPSNNSVRIHTDIIPIDRLVMLNYNVVDRISLIEISFFPYYGDGEQTDQYFNWSLYATNISRTRHMIIDSAKFVPVNTPVTIVCHLSDLPYDIDQLQFITDSPYQTDMNTDVLHTKTLIEIEVPDDQTEETTETAESSEVTD